MSKRLQVILTEDELAEIRRSARAQGMTVAEFVRQAVRAARRRQPLGSVDRKTEIIRAASRHSYPTADVGQMLREIERGYVAEEEVDPH